jgi:hypothetical protein
MTRRWTTGLVVLVLLVVPALAAKQVRLVDLWRNPSFERRAFQKFVVVGIADDIEVRKQFENKFVSHLRGRGAQALVSYVAAPDLTALPSREQMIEFIADEEVDAAISVRVVALGGRADDEWGESWRAEIRGAGTLRELIEESLPVDNAKSPRYGVEATLWDTESGLRIWAGRTDPYTRKQLNKGAGGG